MQVNKPVVLLFFLLPFLAHSSSIALKTNSTVDRKICEKMLEAFWKHNDLNVEGEYHLISKEEISSKPQALSQILNEREQLVEHQRESSQQLFLLASLYYPVNMNMLKVKVKMYTL